MGTSWLLLGLLLEQVGYNLCSGELSLDWLVRAALFWILFINLDLWTWLPQAFLDGGRRECLMDPDSTCTALIPTPVWLPPVVRLRAVLDKLLFVLFGVTPLVSVWFLVQVVLLVRKHHC